MLKKISLFLILIFLAQHPVFPENDYLKKMEDSLARGYLAAGNKDLKEALDHFTESFRIAKKVKSWKGLVDTGNAFSALGQPKKALPPLKNASRIAVSSKDWRGLIAVSLSYASLPENIRTKKKAFHFLGIAYKISLDNKDWHGLLESARAFHKLGYKDKAKAVLVASKEVVKNSQAGPAASIFADTSREMGYMSLYNEFQALAKNALEFHEKYTPFPGWEPFGTSVAGPEKVSIESQIEMRKSTDKDLAVKQEYFALLKKEKKTYTYYVAYRRYYDFPYHNYYGNSLTLTWDNIYNWAHYYLKNYKLVNGVYVYIY